MRIGAQGRRKGLRARECRGSGERGAAGAADRAQAMTDSHQGSSGLGSGQATIGASGS